MTLHRAQQERLKKALKREPNPVKKGDYVALITRHIPTAAFGSQLQLEPYETFHLATVTKADRNGRAVKVALVGKSDVAIDAFGQLTRTLTLSGATAQAMAATLAATFHTSESNTFASADHLKVALRAFSPEGA